MRDMCIARCDIGVHFSVRPSVHNLCQGAYSVTVIAGSMKPCIVITLDTHFYIKFSLILGTRLISTLLEPFFSDITLSQLSEKL